jgi:hypothetical protein
LAIFFRRAGVAGNKRLLHEAERENCKHAVRPQAISANQTFPARTTIPAKLSLLQFSGLFAENRQYAAHERQSLKREASAPIEKTWYPVGSVEWERNACSGVWQKHQCCSTSARSLSSRRA